MWSFLLIPCVWLFTGCSPSTSGAAQILAPPSTLHLHIVDYAGGPYLTATTVPAPESVFAVIAVSPGMVAGANLSCVQQDDLWVCEAGVIKFSGCYAPESADQEPVVRAHLTE